MEPELLTEMEKLNAVQVYISVLGQICLGTAMDPPKHGDPSYDLFIKVSLVFSVDLRIIAFNSKILAILFF